MSALRAFLRQYLVDEPTDHILVAFSGGPDSLCLLWGLQALAEEFSLRVTAGHLDHALDDDSARRALRAAALARRLQVPFHSRRIEPPALGATSRDGLEATARRQRYAFLEELADHLGAGAIATAHHRDDQAETVLLRILYGSGVQGLAGIQPRLGRRIRPLLAVRRQHLESTLRQLDLQPTDDPTNGDLRRPRNRLRHRLLTGRRLAGDGLVDDLARLADTTRRIRPRIRQLLDQRLVPRPLFLGRCVGFDRLALQRLPGNLFPHALALLARHNGLPYPIQAEVQREIRRQLDEQAVVGCDCGKGWRLEADSRRIWLCRRKPSQGKLAYTLSMSGVVEIPELDLVVHTRRGPRAPWMLHGRPESCAIPVELASAGHVIVRTRRPGDRLRPLGSPRPRRLNDLLTDRHVPRSWRDHLPLLVIDGNIAWVPGVTIGDDFRLRQDDPTVWIVSLERRPSPTQESVAVRSSSDDGSKERSKP